MFTNSKSAHSSISARSNQQIERNSWPATIQHFLAVQAGNQGLSCSWAKTESRPSTPRPRRRRCDTNTLCEKKIHTTAFLSTKAPYDIILYFWPPLAHLGSFKYIHTHDWRKGSTKGVEGKKAGYDYTQGEGSLQIRIYYEDILRKELISRDSSREDLLFY
jgi:hypothetical protein